MNSLTEEIFVQIKARRSLSYEGEYATQRWAKSARQNIYEFK